MADTSNIKRNDLFLNLMNNPMYRTVDFMDVGLDASNTTILPAEKYKASEKVKSNPLFQTDGKFDEGKFNQVYNTSVAMFNEMSQTSYDDAVAKEIEYQPGSLFAVHENNPKFIDENKQSRFVEFGKDVEANPDRHGYNTTEMGRITMGKWTPQELAQMHQTYNRKTGKWEDSPETWFGDNWFSKFWNPPVMATYDENDPEVLNGEKTKGEYKLNPNGTYYAERLSGQPVYNKETISMWDTLTKEGSWLNRYDFFDSDDKQKSVVGSMFKTAATVLPAFIPGVGAYYIAASVGFQAAKLGVVGARMLGGGTDTPWINYTENWLNQFGMNVSQHSKENAFTIENFLGLAGDVFMQLKQQRWIFKNAPKLLGFSKDITKEGAADDLLKQYEKVHLSELYKKYPNAKNAIVGDTDRLSDRLAVWARNKAAFDLRAYERNFQKAGSVISKAYMTGITTMDSYNQAKQEGATDLQATMLALGYSAGEYALLNTAIGEMVMPELRIEKQKLRRSIELAAGLEDNLKKAGATPAAKRTFLKKVMDLGKGLTEGRWHGASGAAALGANALGEGIEETSEELLYDVTKSIYNAYFWLTDDKQRYTAWNDMGTRYSMSFLGGLLGGGLFAGTESFSNFGPNGALAKMDNKSAQQNLLYLLREGKRDEIEKQVNKMNFGDKNLSATQLLGSDFESGFAPGTATDNQDKAIKDAFRQTLDYYEGIMKGAGIQMSDNTVIDSNLLGEMRYQALMNSTSASIYLQDFNKAMSDYADSYEEYQKAYNLQQTGSENRPPASDSSKPLNDNETTQANLLDKKNNMLEARAKVQSYVNGERSGELILRGIFETIPYLNQTFKSMTFESWLQAKRGKDSNNLSNEELQAELEEYRQYYEANGKDDLRQNFNIFMDIFGRTNPVLTKSMEDFYASNEKSKAIQSLRQQMDYDNNQLINALNAGASGNTGLYDYIVRIVANPSRINQVTISDTESSVEGSDLNYAPYMDNTNPSNELNQMVNEAVSQLGENPDADVLEKTKNDTALKWYRGFISKYSDSISRVLNDISKVEYIDPQTKRQVIGLYETYKAIIKNHGYDENASKGMLDEIMAFRGSQSLEEDNIINNEDLDPDYFNTTIEKDNIKDLYDFIPYVNGKVSEIEGLLKSNVDENGNPVITSKEISEINKIMSDIESAYTPYANQNMTIDSNVARLLSGIRTKIQSASEFNEYYDADKFEDFGKAVDEISRKPMTPIYSALDSFYVIGGRKPSEVINEVESLFKTASTSPSGFGLTSEQSAHLATVLSQIEMMKSIVHASRNDNGSLANPEGFANLANKMMQGKEGYSEANVIDGKFADMIDTDLERLEARLRSIAALSSFNGTRQLESHRKLFLNRSSIIYRMIDLLKKQNPDVVDFSEIESIFGDSDSNTLKTLASSKTPNYNISDADYNKVFNVTTRLENAIHNAFKDVNTDVDVLKSIISKMDLLQPTTDVFNLDTTEMDSNSFVWYLASILSVDPVAMNNVIAKAYANKDVAPLPAQEMAIRGVTSFLAGKNTYFAISEAYKASIMEQVDDMAKNNKLDELADKLIKIGADIYQNVENYKKFKSRNDANGMKNEIAKIKFFISNSNSFNIFDSIYTVAGIPGSGKTDGVIIPLIRLLKSAAVDGTIDNADKILENIYFVTTDTMVNDSDENGIANRIRKEIGDSGKVSVMNHNELLVDAFGKDNSDKIHTDISVNLSDDGDFIAHSDVRTNKTARSEWPSMIIVDEFSLYDQFDADTLNTFSKEHNIPIVFLGDDQQTSKPTVIDSKNVKATRNGAPIELFDNTKITPTFGLTEAQFVRSQKLGMSMRSNNSQKSTNMTKLRMVLPSLFKGESNAIEFRYHNSGSSFYGDLAAASFTNEAKNAVDTIINDSKDGKIGYIYDRDSDMFKYLVGRGLINDDGNGNVTSDVFALYKNAVDTQGLELKYYLFDKGKALYNDKNDVYRDLYVAISRSRQGAVVVGDYSDTALKLNSGADSDTSISNYNRNAIENYTDRYLSMLNQANENSTFEKMTIEPPIYDSVQNPTPPSNDTDDSSDNTLPNQTTVPDIPDSSLIPTVDNPPTDDGSNPPPPLPDTVISGPIMDGALVESTIDTDTVDGNETTVETDTYEKSVSDANDTGDLIGFSNDEKKSDKAFVFNTLEIGNGVEFGSDSIKYTPGAIDSSNGLIRIIKALFENDKSFQNDRFNIIQFAKANGANYTMDEIRVIFEKTLSDLHNSIINTTDTTSRMASIHTVLGSFIRRLSGKKFDVAMQMKLESMFNESNTRYGLKKVMHDGDTGFDKTNNVNGKNVGNSLFGDKANHGTQRLKFITILGEGDVVVPKNGNERLATASLLEIPIMTPPNVITSFNDNEEFQVALSEVGYSMDTGNNTVLDANGVLNAFANGFPNGKWQQRAVQKYLENIVKDTSKDLSTSVMSDSEVRAAADYYSKLLNIYSLTMAGFIDLTNADVNSNGKTMKFEDILRNARSTGPVIYTRQAGHKYLNNGDYVLNPEEHTIKELANNPHYRISPIYSAMNNDDKYGLKMKLPFVIISTNRNVSLADLYDLYISEIDNDVPKKTTSLVYVVPPRVSFSDYMGKLKNILSGSMTSTDRVIGNSFTSYRILSKLFVDDGSDLGVENIKTVIGRIGASDLKLNVNNQDTTLSQYIYDTLSKIGDVDSDNVSLRNMLIDNNMNRSLNGILFMLATKVNADSTIGDIDSTVADNISNELSSKGFKGVFLFPKINRKSDGVSTVILDNDGVSNDLYTMHIDGDTYEFSIFGKIDSPVLNIDYNELIDVMDRINPRNNKDKSQIRDYYNMIEGIDMSENTQPNVDPFTVNTLPDINIDPSISDMIPDNLVNDMRTIKVSNNSEQVFRDAVMRGVDHGVMLFTANSIDWVGVDITGISLTSAQIVDLKNTLSDFGASMNVNENANIEIQLNDDNKLVVVYDSSTRMFNFEMVNTSQKEELNPNAINYDEAMEAFREIINSKDGENLFEEYNPMFVSEFKKLLSSNPKTDEGKIKMLSDIKEALKKDYDDGFSGIAIIMDTNEANGFTLNTLKSIAEDLMNNQNICII